MHCSRVGKGLDVQGPCDVSSLGTITVGNDVCVRSRPFNRVEISVGRGAVLEVGDHVFLNQGVRIATTDRVHIGAACMIGDETIILDNDYHSVGPGANLSRPVHIGDGVWLATRVIVLRGVTIGDHSVIGCGSVVTRSIPAHSFAAGNPARVIRTIGPR